jgi:hypothetical protein
MLSIYNLKLIFLFVFIIIHIYGYERNNERN